ncbi:MAG: zinc-dependent alcohol dehydrogenase family protein [Vulcanimicrobiaceae bacterium]
MKAMVIPAFGGPDVFEKRDVEKPVPGQGQILVHILATSVNPVDAKIRAAGSWAGITPPAILGYDAAGVVEQVGPCVTDFNIGDDVFYTPEIFGNQAGTYAEYEAVPAGIVAKKPPSLSYTEAAAVPLAGGTAWEAVMRRLQIRAGETFLIHGGAGGVGSFATQIAKAAGARVLATAGPENQATLKQLGADVTIDYRGQDFAQVANHVTSNAGVDAVFDTVGGDLLARSCSITRPFGRLATILSPEGDLTQAYLRNHTIHGIFLTRERRRLEEVSVLLERRQIRPLVVHEWPLEQVSDAHRLIDSGHGRGKIVLVP